MKLRLAVYPNGILSGAHTHMSLLVQNLKREEKVPAKIQCGSYVQVNVGSSSLLATSDCSPMCTTETFCECDNFDKFCQDAGTTEGLICEHKFVPHMIVERLANNDVMVMIVEMHLISCPCSCHGSSFGECSDESQDLDS